MVLGLIRMPVRLFFPGLAGHEGVGALKVRKALDGFPRFPRQPEVQVLELVVESDPARIRDSGQKDAVLSAPDDPAILHNHGSERSASPLLDGFDGQPGRLVHELLLQFVVPGISGAHGFAGGSAGVENRVSFPCVNSTGTGIADTLQRGWLRSSSATSSEQ